MNAQERVATLGLASLFALRMFGMFIILPVFALHAESLPGGRDRTLVGLALGAYGLTQALLQVPFGYASDRWGRKPAIVVGLLIFALGSFVAAWAPDIAGRSSDGRCRARAQFPRPCIALTADLTRDEVRTKAMAAIGMTIGGTFAVSLVAGPLLQQAIGVPGIFALTGVLALAGIVLIARIAPDSYAPRRVAPDAGFAGFARILANRATRPVELRHLRVARGADGAVHAGSVRAARRGSCRVTALAGLFAGHPGVDPDAVTRTSRRRPAGRGKWSSTSAWCSCSRSDSWSLAMAGASLPCAGDRPRRVLRSVQPARGHVAFAGVEVRAARAAGHGARRVLERAVPRGVRRRGGRWNARAARGRRRRVRLRTGADAGLAPASATMAASPSYDSNYSIGET